MTAEERPLLRRANIAIVLNRLIESKANSLSEDKIAGIKMALEEMSKMLGVHDLEIMLETRIDPYGEWAKVEIWFSEEDEVSPGEFYVSVGDSSGFGKTIAEAVRKLNS